MSSTALVLARKTALVLGGGFAGLEAAIQLRKRGLDVTLVSERPFLYIYPISIWVPTGEVRPEDCQLDLGDVARRHGFAFVQGSRPERASYLPHVSITCLMDTGNGAAYVHRDDKREKLTVMPIYGHWAKKAWASYYKLSKKRLVPRLPGL